MSEPIRPSALERYRSREEKISQREKDSLEALHKKLRECNARLKEKFADIAQEITKKTAAWATDPATVEAMRALGERLNWQDRQIVADIPKHIENINNRFYFARFEKFADGYVPGRDCNFDFNSEVHRVIAGFAQNFGLEDYRYRIKKAEKNEGAWLETRYKKGELSLDELVSIKNMYNNANAKLSELEAIVAVTPYLITQKDLPIYPDNATCAAYHYVPEIEKMIADAVNEYKQHHTKYEGDRDKLHTAKETVEALEKQRFETHATTIERQAQFNQIWYGR